MRVDYGLGYTLGTEKESRLRVRLNDGLRRYFMSEEEEKKKTVVTCTVAYGPCIQVIWMFKQLHTLSNG